MRKWYKYLLNESRNGRLELFIDQNFKEHEKAMGGYQSNGSYTDKAAFFDKYFLNYHTGRLVYYDRFLRKHLRKDLDIISIASGRCANELCLMEDGYKVTCSDLDYFDALEATKGLFPYSNL